MALQLDLFELLFRDVIASPLSLHSTLGYSAALMGDSRYEDILKKIFFECVRGFSFFPLSQLRQLNLRWICKDWMKKVPFLPRKKSFWRLQILPHLRRNQGLCSLLAAQGGFALCRGPQKRARKCETRKTFPSSFPHFVTIPTQARLCTVHKPIN